MCPPNGFYEITLLLESKIVGSNKVRLQIMIDSKIPEEERLDVIKLEGDG